MRIVMAFVVIALMALLGASLFYAFGIWTTLGAADLPGWIYAAMAGGVFAWTTSPSIDPVEPAAPGCTRRPATGSARCSAAAK